MKLASFALLVVLTNAAEPEGECSNSTARWSGVEMAPADPILGVAEAYKADTDARKVNLGVGAYRDDAGAPWVLPSVRAAEEHVFNARLDHEYLPIAGNAEFNALSLAFAYGDASPALADGRVAVVQTLSGTGACRVAGVFLQRFSGARAIYISEPTWGNHLTIMKEAGLEVRRYRYFDAATNGLDYAGLREDIEAAPDGSAFLLHACAHNPTGVDPTAAQWAELSQQLLRKRHVVFFDSAYQGFASGDADRDAAAVRRFVADGHELLLAQSYAKNFGLYGERVGALSVVCADAAAKARVESQLKRIARPIWSNPPAHGARVVARVLGDAALRAQWTAECRAMADRIIAMRDALRANLAAAGSTRDWSHITDQIGMFAYTGLSAASVDALRERHHIYMTRDGRMCMAALKPGDVEYVSAAMKEVLTTTE